MPAEGGVVHFTWGSPTRVKNRTVCLSTLRRKKSQTGFLVGGVWRRNPSVLSRCAGGVRKQLYVYIEFAIFMRYSGRLGTLMPGGAHGARHTEGDSANNWPLRAGALGRLHESRVLCVELSYRIGLHRRKQGTDNTETWCLGLAVMSDQSVSLMKMLQTNHSARS